jgi:tellurite methyltransferase
MNDEPPDIGEPSAFFRAQVERLRATASLGPTLDLACGRGRHSLAAAALGLEVLGVDRNAESLADLLHVRPAAGRIDVLESDLELETPPALDPGNFGAVLVFRYLHRPLMPWIESLLAPGGLLLYETFTTDQRALGWGPKSDLFLLRPGELPGLFPSLECISYEEGPSLDPQSARTGRLVATKPK